MAFVLNQNSVWPVLETMRIIIINGVQSQIITSTIISNFTFDIGNQTYLRYLVVNVL